MKFKIGDVVIANKESDKIYKNTNHKKGWKGIVTSVNGKLFDADTISTKNKEEINMKYTNLTKKYFELYNVIEAREV